MTGRTRVVGPRRRTETDFGVLQSPEAVEQEMIAREAARARIIPFCQYMWPDFVTRPHRELIAASLELLEQRRIMRLMIFAPPQYGKSEIVSRNFPAWYMGRHPNHNYIMTSYSSTLAENLSYDARAKLLEPRYRALFGQLSMYEVPVSLSDRSASTREWRIANYRGKVIAAGVGAGITGHGADVASIDDPVKDAAEADSLIIQERNIRWYKSSLLTRMSPQGVILLTMTRWNESDLGGYLLKDQEFGGDLWYVLRLTALAESPAQIQEWCRRNNIPKERFIVADMVSDLKAA